MDDDPHLGAGLKPVTLAEQALFSSRFCSLTDPLSDYTFSQLFTWGNSLRILWMEIRGHLCVFANGTGDLTLLIPPIGEGNSDAALRDAFDVMDSYNSRHQAEGNSRVEYVSEELLRRFDRSRVTVEPMGADYIYDVRRMIDLAGGDLSSKRQLRNRFLRNYQHRVEPYVAARHRDECCRLLSLWKHQQDSQHAAERLIDAVKRQKETLACELSLNHATELGLSGLVVYVRSQAPADAASDPATGDDGWSLRAFTFGEWLGADQSSITIEKTDLGVKGLAQFIFSEFCQRCWSERPLVNAGDDWGLEALAWTKMSYRPVRLLQKYSLRLARKVAVAMPAGGGMSAQSPMLPAGIKPAIKASERQLLLFPDEPSVADVADVSLATPIRTARATDLPAALGLEQACFSAYCLSKRQLSYLQRSPHAVFLVAESGRQIVGQGIALVRQHKRCQSGRIYSLAVRDQCRGRGIGRRLLEAMIDGLVARGVKRVFLEVEEDNLAAVSLYEQSGFRRIGSLPDYYSQGRHGLHMVKMIEEPAASEAAAPAAAMPEAG